MCIDTYGMLLAVLMPRYLAWAHEGCDAHDSRNRREDSPALPSAQGGRAIRYRAGPARIEDGALVRHLLDHLRVCAQPGIDAGWRNGGGLRPLVCRRGWGDHLRRAARDHRLYDYGNRRRR